MTPFSTDIATPKSQPMESSMQKTEDALQSLYTRLVDSADGYRQALESSSDHTYSHIFRDMIARRERNAGELRGYLADRGVEMDDDGSLLAAAHRAFLQLKSMLMDTDEAVLDEIVRGERELLDAYDAAITPAGATTPEFEFLTQQYESLREKVTELEAMKRRAAA